LHLALTVDLSRLAVGEVASIPFVAPDMRLAKQPLTYVQGIVGRDPQMLRLVVGKVDQAESLELERNGRRINAKSIMGVMMLAAGKGSSVTIDCEGEQADEALQALLDLVANRFGEDE
jgi:phosphotransferase system HPr (HPr) family protein